MPARLLSFVLLLSLVGSVASAQDGAFGDPLGPRQVGDQPGPFASETSSPFTSAELSLSSLRRPNKSYKVKDRKTPVTVGGQVVGYLYPDCHLTAEPVPESTGTLRILELDDGFVRDDIAGSGAQSQPGEKVVTGISVTPLIFHDSTLRTVGHFDSVTGLSFVQKVPDRQPIGGGANTYVRLTPVGATVAAADVASFELGDDAFLGFLRPFTSNGVEIRFVSASRKEPNPKFEWLPSIAPEVDKFSKVDFDGGLGEEMGYYKKLARGKPLYIFIVDDPDAQVAYENVMLPVKDRADWHYRRFRVDAFDDSHIFVQEPMPLIVFPKHVAMNQPVSTLMETLKHELGHVLQQLKAPIQTKGYEETFGNHTFVVRSNDQAAFVEGFAEYTAFRFRDANVEGEPPKMKDLIAANNEGSYRTLLAFHWMQFRRQGIVKKRVSRDDLDKIEEKLFDTIHAPGKPPTLGAYKESVVASLTGAGKPPLTEKEVRDASAKFDKAHPAALQNLSDEEYSPEEAKQLSTAFDDIVTSAPMDGHGSEETYQQNLQKFDQAYRRSANDLMINEGIVAVLLLELDKQLTAQGLDFYGKALEAMKKDPYPKRSRPPQPVNIKEFLAVMNSDPELNGKIFPIVEKVTEGALQAKDFELAKSRKDDPLGKLQPGTKPKAGPAGVVATEPRTAGAGIDADDRQVEDAPSGDIASAGTTAVATSVPATSKPTAPPQEEPDFSGLSDR